jgi:hypothetical protein
VDSQIYGLKSNVENNPFFQSKPSYFDFTSSATKLRFEDLSPSKRVKVQQDLLEKFKANVAGLTEMRNDVFVKS